MTKTGKIVAAIIGVVVIAGGIWAITAMTNKPTETQTQDTSDNQSQSSTSEQPSAEGEPAATITFNGTAFEPAAVTVKSGSKIKVVNGSAEVIEFASDPHPTHTINPELNTSDIEPSGSATVTVTKTGSWGYHNHYDPSKRGTVTVE